MVGIRDTEGELTSSDKPALWPAVPMGLYTVLVDLQMKLQEVDKLGYMQLLLDGKVLDNQQYSATRGEPIGWEQDPEQVTLTYTYRLPCLAPGKHLLQARYLLDGRWSRLSRPLRFEASLPAPPKIVAISDSDREPTPVPKAGTISITKSAVKVRLADVTEQDSVVAYLDGKPSSLRLTNESCCRLVQLQGLIEPGVHTLTVRTVWNPAGCSVTSEPSNEVVFHYYDEKVYLLKPTPSVRHKNASSTGEKKEASSREMQSTLNDIPSKSSQPSPVSATGDSQTHSTASERGGIPALPTVLRSVGVPATVTKMFEGATAHLAIVQFLANTAASQAAAAEKASQAAAGAAKLALDAEIRTAALARQADVRAGEAEASAQASARERDSAQATLQNARAVVPGAIALANADEFAAVSEEKQGDSSKARIARYQATRTKESADKAQRDAHEAEIAYNAAAHRAQASRNTASDAATQAQTARFYARQVADHATAAKSARDTAAQAALTAALAADRALAAIPWDDFALAKGAADNAVAARTNADEQAGIATRNCVRAKEHLAAADPSTPNHDPDVANGGRKIPPDVVPRKKPQARKESVHPFFFASTAHFPMREFGVRGEVLDRDGAVIYEDMKFSFDREGNYNVCFTIGTPAVPTTLQLRLLIQATSGGPWYTVTLQPIEFQPTKGTDGKFSPRISRNYVVEGRSEILRRCYGEMGQDATIRREGTARFGFGLAGLSQNTSN
ncbi:MAG: hypothetical protein NTY19_06405 [Planctomycetota bacterium]|nr:hypothetical protein [Planctomycetota bacterium]